ncbi:hypothetical protein HYH03_016321 [Edaphochlamys debaryana]|uniref:peptidylprolyl isomerase n=1 Tax=Edaphochlamys debaryana TaxID=47281 RepID=A0A835XK93_9CHLO|nr:hypothetical protein HYH03_016321 [Edaphochlamys debaryana]|eukprot:KAG2484935.1 hypothetical protein HYH03_016321 [Edaphochlamys debaryana]
MMQQTRQLGARSTRRPTRPLVFAVASTSSSPSRRYKARANASAPAAAPIPLLASSPAAAPEPTTSSPASDIPVVPMPRSAPMVSHRDLFLRSTSPSYSAPNSTRRDLFLRGAAFATLALSVTAPPPSLGPAGAARAREAKAPVARDPGDWSTPGLGAPLDPNVPAFRKTDSGIRIQELLVGSGPVAAKGDDVLFDFVLRRNNGYFIYSTVEGVSFQPRDVPVGPISAKLGSGQLIAGLDEVLEGMSPGSKRRALIPPELGYVAGTEGPRMPTFGTERQLENHKREALLFEVQVLRVGGRK